MKVLVVCQDALRAEEISRDIADVLEKEKISALLNPETDAYQEMVMPRELERIFLLIEPDVDDVGKNHLQAIIAKSLNLSFRQISVLSPFC